MWPWYLAEDFAFCERARQCGYTILADTTIRLGHIGSCEYSWEEAGSDTRLVVRQMSVRVVLVAGSCLGVAWHDDRGDEGAGVPGEAAVWCAVLDGAR